MNLNEERTFQVNNTIYVLGSPIIPVEMLEQLAYSLSQQDISNRPIVIINPQANTIPDFDKLLENYIENYTAGKQKPSVNTSYAFETATDADIETMVSQQFSDLQSPMAQQQIAIYQTIRKQSQVKHQLAKYQDEASELWRQHCINPNAAEGSERYAELVYTLMPQTEQELKEVSTLLARLSSSPVEMSVPAAPAVEPTPEPVVEPEQSAQPEPIVQPEPAQSEVTPEPIPVAELKTESSVGTQICLCAEWRDAGMKRMPQSVAENIAQSANYQKFQTQQSIDVPGYQPVDLWILCQLGIPLYPDGVPIVYTLDGKFQRVGVSDRSILDANYWFPHPIFENYYEIML